jgi:uncharacterized membrane protein YjgN (DUF898 family)
MKMKTSFPIPKTKYIIYVILINSILTLLTVFILNIFFVQEDATKAKSTDEQGNQLEVVLTNNINDTVAQ